MTFAGTIITLLIIVGLAIGLFRLYQIFLTRKESVKAESKDYSLISISVPKENEKTPEAAESLFAAIHGIYKTKEELPANTRQEHISFEVVAQGEEIRFFCYTPTYLKDFVEGQIYAQYPDIEIREVQDYSQALLDEIFTDGEEKNLSASRSTCSTELVLDKKEYYPLKTFENFDVDPLAAITGVLGKITKQEDVWIQIMVRPKNDTWQQTGISFVEAIKAGRNPNQSVLDIIKKGVIGFIKDLIQTALQPPTEGGGGDDDDVELAGPVAAAMEGIEEKITKLGFQTKIRLTTVGPDKVQARNRLQSVVGAFKQFNTNNMNGFVSLPPKLDDKAEIEHYSQRLFPETGYTLNIEELASLFHLPNISVKTPNMIWAGSKKGEAPGDLPIISSQGEKNSTPFAETDFRGKTEKFGILNEDLRRHMYFIGKTGVGKTTALQNMAIHKIRKGHGVGIIDPHGDFIDEVIEFIPEDRMEDVVLIDPADRDFPVAFNPLESVDEDLKNIVSSGLVGIFKKIWAESWGPRLEHILRNTILALLDDPDATLLGIPKMLVDQNYRDRVVEKIKDPVVKDFWITEFGQYDQRFRTEAIAPIQNKVGQFLSASTIRNILGQKKSTIDFKDIMDNKKILLMDLSKGKVGEDASALMGAMLITKIQLTAMQRASIPEKDRVDFTLFVDEFQNFATESFATILSEARKYKLSLIMANQYIAQMEEVVREAIFGNVGSLISFRVGPTDAPYLAKEFMPTFEETDLINLDKFQIYIKMAIDHVTSPPFSAKTLAPYTDKDNLGDKFRELNRRKYAHARAEVEKAISDWDDTSSKSIAQEKEEKLNTEDRTHQGKKYQAKVGTDNRVWYIEKEDNKASRQAQGKQTKQGRAPRQARGKQAKQGRAPRQEKKQPNKKLLKEHLQGLVKDNKLPTKKQPTKKDNQKLNEGEKVDLNGE